MFSEPGSCSFVVSVSSNSSVFVSDKDPNSNMDQDEFGLLVRPAMEIHKEEYCQTSTLEEEYHRKQLSVHECDQQEEDHNKEHQEQGNVIISVPVALPPLKNLKLEIPFPSYEQVVGGSENDGFKTPTSSDQKITVFLPGAPRKTKSVPAKKRRTCRRRIVLDMSKELESLFPCMPFVVDLCASGKNKKLKH